MINNAVSLFAGVGGFDLALYSHDIPVVATSEIDDAARAVLSLHFPNTTHFGDVAELTGQHFIDEGFDAPTGIITGGFPCQPFSIAGRQEGIRDPRGTLFWQILRLSQETDASHILLENVPGLLTMDGGWTFRTMLTHLTDAGYALDFDILDAQYFGVPQRRRRLFIIGKRVDLIEPEDAWLDSQRLMNEYLLNPTWDRFANLLIHAEWLLHPNLPYAPWQYTIPYTAHLVVKEYLRYARPSSGEILGKAPDTATWRALVRQAKDLSASLYDLADRLCSQQIFPDPEGGSGDSRESQPQGPATTGFIGSSTATGVLVPVREQVSTLQGGGRRGYRIDAEGAAGGHLVPFIKSVRSGARDADGNLPPEVWVQQDVAPTINVFDNAGESRATVLSVGDNLSVRRLTPLECERLQGFPDDWTKYRMGRHGESVEQKDSRRFQQMGNAVAVPVVEWILSRIMQ